MLRFIVMICGYAENSCTAPLIYQCGFFGNQGYASHQQAITDLALDLYAKYCDDYAKQTVFDNEEFMRYVSGLTGTTCDSYGDAEWANGRNLIWFPFWKEDFIGTPKEEVIFIQENAELVLLAALQEAKPELKTSPSDFDCREWEDLKKLDKGVSS